MFENQTNTNDSVADAVAGGTKIKNTNDRKSVDFYLSDLPLNDSLIKRSDKRIVDAYYNLASTYKEELNNNKKAIATFEELNSRYADNKYKLSTYFQLYRIFTSVKNQSQADYYKNKILNEYPNSEYAQIIKNPKYISDKAAQKERLSCFTTMCIMITQLVITARLIVNVTKQMQSLGKMIFRQNSPSFALFLLVN